MVRVVFLHPDLGIGGAERLVVDAALAIKSKGHEVHIVTSHHDPGHCFPETRDGTIPVTVSGDWLPRSLFGRFYALCAYIRMVWAALYVVLFSKLQPQVYFCDQVSICIPVLMVFSKAPVLFYCHFPDQLLASHNTKAQQFYRAPLDWLEETTTGLATKTVVNSKFTAGIFRDTFHRLTRLPEVLYPSLNFDSFDRPVAGSINDVVGSDRVQPGDFIFLSINRYERKKNLPLALQSFALLRASVSRVHLVMAGGYDERLKENVEHFEELKQLASTLALGDSVTFLRSPRDDAKSILLRDSQALLYTPDKEHFGIVPLEAMYCRLPVIAVSSGGPLETIEDHKTGFLCPQTAEEFAEKMSFLFFNPERAKEMGQLGRKRVIDHFSFNTFSRHLNGLIEELAS